MRNIAQITPDLKFAIAGGNAEEGGKLPIGKRGVLLSILGNDLSGAAVTPELDAPIAAILRTAKAFYEFDANDLVKNHVMISYQEQTNTLFVVGVTDVIVGFANPQDVPKEKVRTIGVKLKSNLTSGLASRYVVLIRQEGDLGKPKKLAFYLIDTIPVS